MLNKSTTSSTIFKEYCNRIFFSNIVEPCPIGDINFDFQLNVWYLPLSSWVEPRARMAIPSTVRVPCQAAVSTGCTVDVASMQRHLGNPFIGAHIQLLLLEEWLWFISDVNVKRGLSAGTHCNICLHTLRFILKWTKNKKQSTEGMKAKINRIS